MNPVQRSTRVAASFRDPSGFLFRRDCRLLRQVNRSYREEYDRLLASKLFERLVGEELLIPHRESEEPPLVPEIAYKVLEPDVIPFISYPYEWAFSQLKDAALLTLRIQEEALDHGMSLKDCSAYNVQFVGAKPIFIDTLSFERYEKDRPWVAYRQFCEHFLAPLALMAMTDVRLSQLLRSNIDGVPLDLASKLLPMRSAWKPLVQAHVHLHARSIARHSSTPRKPSSFKFSELKLRALLDSLRSLVTRLRWRAAGTEWADYYDDTNYTRAGADHKKHLVEEFLTRLRPRTVWDLGANTGVFSRAASERGASTVSLDLDPACVERNYLSVRREGAMNLLPLVLDLGNPSPGIGWMGEERMSIWERGPADVGLALALIHHLAIGRNLPFEWIVDGFGRTFGAMILEFVPKEDSQVQRLLAGREDVFDEYSEAAFESALDGHFAITEKERVKDSLRILYLLQKS